MPPEPTPRHPLHANMLQFYNARAPSYDAEDSFHPTLAHDFIHWSTTLPAAPPPHTGPLRVLDLCCGTGLVSFAARQHFGPKHTIVHGVDISQTNLEMARSKAAAVAAEEGGEMWFCEGSVVALEALGLQRRAYGLLACCSAFVLLPGERAALVRAWAEYMAAGGVLVFDVPAPGAQIVYKLVSRVLERYGVATVSQDWVVEGALAELVERAGLKCEAEFVTRVYKAKEYRVEEAEEVWEMAVANPLVDVSKVGERDREAAKRDFVRMMKEQGGESGVVKDEYKLMICIASNTLG